MPKDVPVFHLQLYIWKLRALIWHYFQSNKREPAVEGLAVYHRFWWFIVRHLLSLLSR